MRAPAVATVVVAVLGLLASGCGVGRADPPTDGEAARQVRSEVDGLVASVLPGLARDVDGWYPIGVSGHYVGCGTGPSSAFLVSATLRSPGRPGAVYSRVRRELVAAGLEVSASPNSLSGRRDGLVATFFSFTRGRGVTTGYVEVASRCAELSPSLVTRLGELPEHVYDGLPTRR